MYFSTNLLWSTNGFISIPNFHPNAPCTLPSLIPFQFFSAWRKVYDLQPYVRILLIQAMEEICNQIDVGSVHGWICHSRFVPHCLVREDKACDVDEAF